jgi:hypothetical protein
VLPARVSFNGAVITGIATGPGSVALSLDSVTAENGHRVSGWLRFDGITGLLRDGESVTASEMAGTGGDVLTLEQGDGGRVRLVVLWHAPHGPVQQSYLIDCRRADWLQREEQ